MKLWAHLFGTRSEKRMSVDDYMSMFSFNGVGYPIVGANTSSDREQVENNFVGYVRSAYKANGVVFACMLARLSVFSEARFGYQDIESEDMTFTGDLGVLERPWPNGSTGELLARMIQDVDLAGNFYAAREGKRLRRLRPDWVQIVLTAPPDEAVESDVAGYLYWPGGRQANKTPMPYLPEQIVHWSPLPDPEAQYRGMSWLTPVIREIQADKYATEHKLKFFTNGATLQTIISLKETVKKEDFTDFVKLFVQAHQGVENAYRNLVVGGGADVTLVGADLRQLDFKNTQGAGETRIAAASGIHPVIIGLSEGLSGSSLNAGNFNSARRLTADKTLRPLWRSASAALSNVIKVPAGKRLWWDPRGIAFLREDVKDLAEILAMNAQAIRTLLDAGYEPDAATSSVVGGNLKTLMGKHTGWYSVQLQKPGSGSKETPSKGDSGEDDS